MNASWYKDRSKTIKTTPNYTGTDTNLSVKNFYLIRERNRNILVPSVFNFGVLNNERHEDLSYTLVATF
jgi:hypothetical protein